MSAPRTAVAFVAAAAVLGAIFWLRQRERTESLPAASSAAPIDPASVTGAPPPSDDAPPLAAESASAAVAPVALVPVVESKGGDPPTLADVTIAVRAAIKKEVRRCNPGKPITPAIANKRVVFYFTQQLTSGTVRLIDVAKIDSDLGDDRLENCILNRVGEVKLSAPGASDTRPRLQETVDLSDLAPLP